MAYRLVIKTGSNVFRGSAILCILENLNAKNIDIAIYEPALTEDYFDDIIIVKDIDKFKNISDIIAVNKVDELIEDVTR